MTRHRFDRPDGWIQPRPYTDASLRTQKHGRILPMETARNSRRAWERLFVATLAALIAVSIWFAWQAFA